MTPKPVRLKRIRGVKTESPNGLPVRYVGRGSRYGNPYYIQKGHASWDVWCIDGDGRHLLLDLRASQEAALRESCRYYARDVIPQLRESGDLKRLRNCNLSCWCKIILDKRYAMRYLASSGPSSIGSASIAMTFK